MNRMSVGVLERIARTLGVGPEFFYEGLGEAGERSDRRRALLWLAQDFTRLDIGKQQAILDFSRVLAGINSEDVTELDSTM